MLSDPEKKAQYDRFGDQMFGGQSFQDFASSQGAGIDLDELLRAIFGGGGNFNSGFGGGFGSSSGFGSSGGFGGFNRMPNLDS